MCQRGSVLQTTRYRSNIFFKKSWVARRRNDMKMSPAKVVTHFGVLYSNYNEIVIVIISLLYKLPWPGDKKGPFDLLVKLPIALLSATSGKRFDLYLIRFCCYISLKVLRCSCCSSWWSSHASCCFTTWFISHKPLNRPLDMQHPHSLIFNR